MRWAVAWRSLPKRAAMVERPSVETGITAKLERAVWRGSSETVEVGGGA
jgi:hypothetical protein